MKKLLLFSSLFLILSSFAYTSEDLSNANSLADQKIVTKQTIASKYALDNKILRQEVIAMALKMKGINLPENYKCKKYFVDATSSSNWVCRAIEIAADNGIITKGNKYANPGKYVTRAEALAMIYNVSGLEPGEMGTITYGDKDIVTWQKQLLIKIYGTGITIPGMKKILSWDESELTLYFYPNRLATRAEVFGFAKSVLDQSAVTEGYCGFEGVNESCQVTNKSYTSFGAQFGPDLVASQSNDFSSYSFGEKKVKTIINEGGYEQSMYFSPFSIYSENSKSIRTIFDNSAVNFLGKGEFYQRPYYIFSTKENQEKNIVFPGTKYTISVLQNYNGSSGELINVLRDINFDLNIDLDNRNLSPTSADILFVYYAQIDNGSYLGSYTMRFPADISLETFKSWYKNTDSVTFREDTLEELDPLEGSDPTYEFLVDMIENGVKSTYKVVSRVNLEKFTIDNISSVKQ